MRLRTTLVLLALVVGIGLYIKFIESKGPNTEEATRRAGNVVNFDRDNIDGIVIQNGEERVELKRVDKKWRMDSPVKDSADSSTIDSLLFDLEDWKRETTIPAKEIESDKNKMAEFGLAKAKLRLKLSGKEAPPEILFGNNAALENRTYVRLENSKDVLVAPQSIKTAVSKKAEEFRDRRLTETVATQVTRLAVKTPAGEMELEKRGDHWQIVKPLRARADDQKVNDLLAQITTSRIAQFVADDRGDLHPYGLAEPRGTVTIFTADDKNGQLVQIGSAPEKEKEQIYVRFAPRNFVFAVPKAIETVLNTKPNDLRDRHLVRFDSNQLDRITIEAPGKTKTTLARKGENWTIANHKDQTANSAEARRLMETLSNEQVAKFVEDVKPDLPKYGLDQPQLTVTLSSFASENTAETKAGEHPLATIAFGKSEGDAVYARVGDEPFIVAVRKTLLDEIFANPLRWQELTIYKFKPEQIHRLSVMTEREQSLLRGTNNQWHWATGDEPINTTNVGSLLNTLASLRAVRWVSEVPADAFAKPQLVITFSTSPDDKATHKLTIGSIAGEGMWLARADEREGTFVVSNPDLNALKLPLAQAATPKPSPSMTAKASPTPTPSR